MDGHIWGECRPRRQEPLLRGADQDRAYFGTDTTNRAFPSALLASSPVATGARALIIKIYYDISANIIWQRWS